MDSPVAYASYGLTSLHDSLGDFVVYRNLVPADPSLPSLADIRERLDRRTVGLPRKADPAYGQVLTELLRCARETERPATALRRLVYIGDTRMNDSTAFRNLCSASQWPGWAFIGQDRVDHPLKVQTEGNLYVANRWAALPGFLVFLREQGFALDEETAVVVDIDKTFIGARGRNDKVIDAARVEAVKRTVSSYLGSHFDELAFDEAYALLNQPAYHAFTADNQDYLAYISLVLGAGIYGLDQLVEDIGSGNLMHFEAFVSRVEDRRSELAQSGLLPVHESVWSRVRAGDPTPFKSFRYNEYLSTVSRFGRLGKASTEELLAKRITITQEVCEVAGELHRRGALIFGISDKPDEASVPSRSQAEAGMQPLHRLEAVAVGQCPPA